MLIWFLLKEKEDNEGFLRALNVKLLYCEYNDNNYNNNKAYGGSAMLGV
jgi:hypothetical protein